MRDLTLNELSIINGGYRATIKPSDWVASAAAGAAFGAACCVVHQSCTLASRHRRW